MVKAIIICAQPGAGKSAIIPLAAQILSQEGGLFISLDNEDFGVRPETRIAITSSLNLENPDDPMFRRTIGLNILLDTMNSIANHLRCIAQSFPDTVGLIHLPDKDPESMISGKPIFEKTIADYEDRGIQIIAVVALTFKGTDQEFVSAFSERLQRGGNGSAQALLDQPKLDPNDMLLRRGFCQKTAKLYNEACLDLRATPEANATTLAAVIAPIL